MASFFWVLSLDSITNSILAGVLVDVLACVLADDLADDLAGLLATSRRHLMSYILRNVCAFYHWTKFVNITHCWCLSFVR